MCVAFEFVFFLLPDVLTTCTIFTTNKYINISNSPIICYRLKLQPVSSFLAAFTSELKKPHQNTTNKWTSRVPKAIAAVSEVENPCPSEMAATFSMLRNGCAGIGSDWISPLKVDHSVWRFVACVDDKRRLLLDSPTHRTTGTARTRSTSVHPRTLPSFSHDDHTNDECAPRRLYAIVRLRGRWLRYRDCDVTVHTDGPACSTVS